MPRRWPNHRPSLMSFSLAQMCKVLADKEFGDFALAICGFFSELVGSIGTYG